MFAGGFAHAKAAASGPHSHSLPFPLCLWKMLALQFATNKSFAVSSAEGCLWLTFLQPKGPAPRGPLDPSMYGQSPLASSCTLCHLQTLLQADARWRQSAAQERLFWVVTASKGPYSISCHQSNLSSAGGASEEQ